MRKLVFAALGAAALLVSAAATAQSPPAVDNSAIMAPTPPQLLSAFHFFRDAGGREANTGVTPYELNTVLYSDGALKYRYVYMPPSTHAVYRDSGALDFPVGTVLIKTFAFAADMAHPDRNVRFLETRLLIHRANGWFAYPYVWNEAQTEATLSPIGATIPISFKDTDGQTVQLDWAVPNRNQCKGCHDVAGAVTPIGPTARNLNRSASYAAGAESQLAHWRAAGMIDNAPADAPHFANAYDPASGTLEERARAYLQVNCAHCHNPDGPAHTSGLDLRYDDTTPVQWGMFKRPVAAGRGSSNMDFDIYPGHPDQSILVYRMASTDPGEMMPELGRQRVDTRAVALMREWIASMPAPAQPPR
ncbi:MAG: SO2930 family diheme c-type cytochrome [Terricaulis sp.]